MQVLEAEAALPDEEQSAAVEAQARSTAAQLLARALQVRTNDTNEMLKRHKGNAELNSQFCALQVRPNAMLKRTQALRGAFDQICMSVLFSHLPPRSP